jgi:glycosyltransferase involved in cell wall biosynthesis
LRVVVDDYAGHGFQIELSRALATRGHQVSHTYCSTNVTPQGDLVDSGSANLSILPVSTGRGFDKYSLPKRLIAELRYGLKAGLAHRRFAPEVILCSNVPLVSLLVIRILNRRSRHVLWLQDIQSGLVSVVMTGIAARLSKVLGILERSLIRRSDHVVVISDSMATLVEVMASGVSMTVIENWAPVDDFDPANDGETWKRQNGLIGFDLILYSGTLGKKHRPGLLVALGEAFAADALVRVVVASESPGVEDIREAMRANPSLTNIVLLPFQDHEVFGEMLAAADVLVVVLEQEARSYSIPSKVLSYLSAGRAIVGSLPTENSSFDLIANRAEAGLATDDDDEFVSAARKLMADPELRRDMGRSGRRYAEKNFVLDRIVNEFVSVLDAGTPASAFRQKVSTGE